MNKFETGFGQLVVRYRWLIIAVTLVTVGIISSGMGKLSFNNDSRVFFSGENPQLQALEALENTFSKSDNILFVVEPKDGNVFIKKTLAAIIDLTEEAWKIPFSSRVNSLTNYQHTTVMDDDLIVADLVEDASKLSEGDLKRIREIALAETMLVNRTVSDKGHVTGVNVTIQRPGLDMNEPNIVANYSRDVGAKIRAKYPDLNIHITGGVMLDNGFGEATQDDMSFLIPAMYTILLVIIALTLRSIVGVIGTLLVIIFAMFSGLGFVGFSGMSLNPASANAPTIILTLAVADSIHLLVTMYYNLRHGMTKHEAVAESLRVNFTPVLLTSATTAIGFLTMNFSDAPPFRDLGNIVAVGVMAAFVYSVTFLPAFMAVMPMKAAKSSGKGGASGCQWLAEFVIKYRKPVFYGSMVAIALISIGSLKIELDDDWIQYFDKKYDFRQASDFTQDNLTGFDVIEYSLESGESGGINNPEYLQKLEDFAQWYRTQPKVVHVLTITDIMKRLNRNMHADDPAYYKIPEDRELAAQYLLLYEMSLPFGLDLNNQINVDKSATRMLVTLANTTTTELRESDDRAREWLEDNALESMYTYGSGLSVMWAHISKRNIDSMLKASFGALALISLILIVALRSFKLGMLSLIPNLAPAFMAFGVWGYLVGQVGLAVSVLVALTLGIVVDDTVHFLSKYLRARREHGMNPEDAVRYSFNTVGTALWITTLALVAGFGMLAFSGFKVNSDMGLMTAVTISLALALDFIFLPTLLMKVEGSKDETTDDNTNYAVAPATAGSEG